MAKAKLIKFDPFADENITPEITRAKRNARPRKRKAPYHRQHKTVSASVSNELVAWLDDVAAQSGITRSQLIADVLAQFRADSDGIEELL